METNPKDFRNAERSDVKWGAVLYTKEKIRGGLEVYRPQKISRVAVRNVRAKVGENDFKHRERVKGLNKKKLRDYRLLIDNYYIKINGKHDFKRQKKRVASLPPRKSKVPQHRGNWK